MRIDILTLFPEVCRAPLNESMMKRAQESGALELRIHNLRDWTTDKHHIVDDAPFGGGPGMVMKPEPIFAAVESLRGEAENNVSSNVLDDAAEGTDVLPGGASRMANFQANASHHHLRALRRNRSSRESSIWSTRKFRSAITCSPTARSPPWFLSMRSCDCCRACSVTNNRPRTTVSAADCWKVRNTRGRLNSADGKCRTFCCPEITQRSQRGGKSRRCNEPGRPGRICCLGSARVSRVGFGVSPKQAFEKSANARRVRQRARRARYPETLPRITQELIPPKPNELLST